MYIYIHKYTSRNFNCISSDVFLPACECMHAYVCEVECIFKLTRVLEHKHSLCSPK